MKTVAPLHLPDATPKNHWSVGDSFAAVPHLVRSFVHRDYSLAMHAHDFVEVNLVLRGEGYHYLPERRFPLRRGDAFVIPPSLRHGYHSCRDLDVRHLLIHPAFLERYGLELRALPGYLLFFTAEPLLREESGFRYRLCLKESRFTQAAEWLSDLETEAALGDAASVVSVEGMALALLACLCRWYAQAAPAAGDGMPPPADRMQSVQAAISLVDARFSEKLGLDDLARAAHLQRNHFCRVFRQATGMTPMSYVNHVRVFKARDLLAHSDRSITEIGAAVGFYDTAHFSRSFRKILGESPSDYRKRLRLPWP